MRSVRKFTPHLLSASAALLIGAALNAQNSPQTIPQGYLGTNLTGTSGNSWPFNNTSSSFRTMFVYDGKQIKHAGPVLISRLRFKIYNASIAFTVTTYNKTTIRLATCPSPQSHTNISTTYANNLGKDVKVIFSGTFKSQAKSTATGLWFIDIKLATPFLYDKSKGDLTFDFQRDGTIVKTTTTAQAYKNGTPSVSHGGRVYGAATAATGAKDTNVGIVEVTYTPAKGLFSDFTATPSSGPGPLTVQFTDKTFTSSAGGVKAWAWDFDGDNKVDSTKQNPVFVYPKTTWDATYDVSLTTIDGVNPLSKITKKAFITVDPSNALAVNFGSGSTNKAVPTPIAVSANTSIYSAAAVRGFFFQAPTTLVINGFEAPNNYTAIKQTHQTVTCYVLAKAPPAFSASYTATTADVRFHGTGLANTVLKPSKPIVVLKGQWVGVLGACHLLSSTSVNRNSYGAGAFKSTVMGMPITLNRMLMQVNHRGNRGVGPISSEGTASIARVFIHVAGNNTVPTLTTIGVPRLGATAKLDLQGRIAGAQGGIILLGAGRLPAPVPTSFGNLLIRPPFFLSIFVANGTGQVSLPVPAASTLTGVTLDFQGMVFNLTSATYGMTNGTEWFIGK